MSLILEIVKNYCDAGKNSLDHQDTITALLAVREANRNANGTYDNKFTLAERNRAMDICQSAKADKLIHGLFIEKGQGCQGDTTLDEIQIAISEDELKTFMARDRFGAEFIAEFSRINLRECKATEPKIDEEVDLLEEAPKKSRLGNSDWDVDPLGVGGS